MAQKFCGEMVKVRRNYVSIVGGWSDEDKWGGTEYRVIRRLIIRRGAMGLAVKSSKNNKVEVLIGDQLCPISRDALVPVR